MKSKLTLVAFLLLFALSARADIYTGLVSYWPMETKTTTTPDASFGNDLTVVGAPTIVAGQFGNAINFPTTSDYLTINHGADNGVNGLPIFQAKTYTIAFWVKALPVNAKALFTEAVNPSTGGPFLILQTGAGGTGTTNKALDVIIRSDNGTTLLNHVGSTNYAFTSPVATWHHIAWVDNNGACQMFIDGNPDKTFSYTNNSIFTFGNTTIGALIRTAVSMQYAGAAFDEVALWERALSAAEVLQVKTSGLTSPVAPRAPVFISPPASVTKNVGDWVLYSASAINNRPFTYQWFKNGTAIPSATDRTYRIRDLQTNNSGDYYSVSVTNSGGSINSTNAVITVTPDTAPLLTSGILAYWPLDEITNNPSMGTTNSPELYSSFDMVGGGGLDTPALVAGQYGNALNFDGFTQFARRTNGVPVYNNLNYSVSLWVKADGTGQNDRRVFSDGNSTNNTPLFSIGTDTAGTSQGANIFIRTDANVNPLTKRSTTNVFDNIWHHLVWTDANGKGKLYVDGILDDSDFTYVRGALTLDRTLIGATARGVPSNFYFGAIDEVANWNRILNYTEIQQLRTNGVPVPVAKIPPSITFQPASQTSGVFTGDTVTFTVQAAGTSPLSYQWRKNNVDISANPTATTNSLVLTNVQSADSANYTVVITNAAGSITSVVAQLTVTPYTPATTGVVMNVDVGSVGFPNLQPGFSEFTLATNPTNFGGVGLNLSGIGVAMADRLRPTPVNNPPGFNQGLLFQDFIFGNGSAVGTGLRIQISRLAPNTKYGVTMWSFDTGSANPRSSDWIETASGTPVVIQNAYTFNGSIQPTNDFEQTLGGLLTSSSTGTLQIEGRVIAATAGAGPGVFLNAIRLEANPSIQASNIVTHIVGSNLVFTVTMNYPGQAVSILQSTDLTGPWSPLVNGVSYTNGMVVTTIVPMSDPQVFYRASTATN